MLDPLFRAFERRIDPFARHPIDQPPDRLAAFYRHYVGQAWPAFVALLGVGLVGGIIEVSLYAFLGNLIDLMKSAETPAAFFRENGRLLVAMGLVALVARPLVSLLQDLVNQQMIVGPFTARIRWQTHVYLLRQSLAFFQNDFAGRIASRQMQTAPALRETLVQVVEGLWHAIVHVTGALILFGQADLRLVVPLVAWLALYGLALRYFVPRIRERSFALSEARSMLTGRVVDSYTNMATVKLFAHAEREEAYAREAIEEHLDAHRAQLRLITLMELTLYSLNGALIVGSTGLALWLWSAGHVTLGAIALTSALVMRIINMSGWILRTVAGIFENMGVVEEGMQTIARPQQVRDVPAARALAVQRGAIRFEDVSFNYGRRPDGGLLPVVEHLRLDVAPGEKVGLVGRSGAGKSTLVNLLLRFYDISGGRILIDGQDISQVTQESLRAAIGMVSQDTSLLHRSILDNIRYGRPEASPEQVIEAARRAQAHEFILGLEDQRGRKGYAAHVGERGVKLSGGQRQRIALARVLLKDAPILVLDEATSALDSEVEAAIQEQLADLMAGKTVIAIAHRLSTIAAMDRLVIMDRGRIVEQGTHADLLRAGGLYAELWARQSGGFIAKEAAE